MDNDIEIELLQYVYDILKSIEKDQSEISPKQSECSQKVLELHKQLESAREIVARLPGIDLNKEQQLQKLENFRNQLSLKQELLGRYKDIKL